jgi:hypothetical protein
MARNVVIRDGKTRKDVLLSFLSGRLSSAWYLPRECSNGSKLPNVAHALRPSASKAGRLQVAE